MIVYEKNNKLNISFENNVKEQPDIVLGKEDGKTEILVDGSSNSGLPEYDDTMEGSILVLVRQPRVLIEAQTVTFNDGFGDFTHGFDATGFSDNDEAQCTMNGKDCIFVWQGSANRFIYNDGTASWIIYPNGELDIPNNYLVM